MTDEGNICGVNRQHTQQHTQGRQCKAVGGHRVNFSDIWLFEGMHLYLGRFYLFNFLRGPFPFTENSFST